MLTDLLQGFGILIVIVIYIVTYNAIYYKITGDDFSDTSCPPAAWLLNPFLIPICIVVVGGALFTLCAYLGSFV
jgi:hypothetical protein